MVAKNSQIFPSEFPTQLADAAFVSGNEVAWPLPLTIEAVEWLGAHGYAVLGTELWLIQDGVIQSLPIGLSGMTEVHGSSVNRESREGWRSFVDRATMQTVAYLQSFNPAEIVEHGLIHFNVTWVSEAQFDKLPN